MPKRRSDPAASVNNTGRRRMNVPAALCSLLGTLLLLAVIAACLPVTVAHLRGYEVYNIVSGSMEPAIPVGSAIFVQATNPNMLAAGDVIAFWRNDSVVAHRVVENDALASELVTKGDANAKEDVSPVPYHDVIGIVTRHTPVLGGLLGIYTSGSGRMYAVAVAAAGALLNMAGARLRRGKNGEPETADGETDEGTDGRSTDGENGKTDGRDERSGEAEDAGRTDGSNA